MQRDGLLRRRANEEAAQRISPGRLTILATLFICIDLLDRSIREITDAVLKSVEVQRSFLR